MSEWQYAQKHPEDRLARIQQFSMVKKKTSGEETEIFITVREYLTPKDPSLRFYATADCQTNQNAVPYTPCGWGMTLLDALSACVREVHRFDLHA